MRTVRLLAVCAIFQIAAWSQQTGLVLLEISGDVRHPRTFQETKA